MTRLKKTLLAIFVMISLMPITMAQPNIVIGGTSGGQVKSFEFSVENTGTTGAYVLPLVYYWNGSSWVMAQNARAVGVTTSATLAPTPWQNHPGYSFILVNPGDFYIIYTQQVIPSGNQWIAWNAYQWNNVNQWIPINSNYNMEQYKID